MKATLKNLAWRSSALLLIFSMLLSVVKLPLVYAYFTSESTKESGGFSFHIYKEDEKKNTNANLALPRHFLFEEEDSGGTEFFQIMKMDSEFMMDGGRTYSTDGLQTETDTHIRQPYPGETVEAEITVEEDFDVDEVFIPSVKLHYEDKFSFALTGEIIEAALVATFDFNIIWSWFQNLDHIPDYVTLAVSGEGYSEDDSTFFFTGETTLQLKGKYDIRDVNIVGPDVLFIPPEETITSKLKMIDQDGSTLTGVSWTLVEAVEGVSLDEKTGDLSLGEEAVGKTIMIEGSLESQGRHHAAWKVLGIYPYPQLEILGADSIIVPLPGENISESYDLIVSHDFQVEEVAWSLHEGDGSIEVDTKGLVTLSGEARGDSFTITAQVRILETSFTIEKEVGLHIIQIGSVHIEGDVYHITVPSGDSLSAYYTAKVYGPDGNKLPGEPVTWNFEPQDLVGLTLSDEGELIVDSSAGSNSLVLEAVSVRDPSVRGTLSVNVERPPSPESRPVEEELPITIHGENYILIPEGDNHITFQYTATSLKDFSADELTWSIQDDVTGVAVDAAGLLTVKGNASEGPVVLLVSAQKRVDGEDEGAETETLHGKISIILAHPLPTSMEISGAPSSITIPVSDENGEAINTFQLSAVLLDQKGKTIQAEIAWSLEGSPLGVDLDGNGLLTVRSEAVEGDIFITASAAGIAVEVFIGLFAPEQPEEGSGPLPPIEQEKDNPAKEDPVIKPEEDDVNDKDGENEEDAGEPAPDPEENPGKPGGSEPDPLNPPDEEAVTPERDEEDEGVGDSGDDTDSKDSDSETSLPNGKLEGDEDDSSKKY